MAIREDLVASAVAFLQDPSVANSPLDKRVAFLQSKNLTQEEVDASLARAGDAGSAGYAYSGPQAQQQQQQLVPRQAPPPYGYTSYPGSWQQQPPPPEVPRRDWRDYFIMATVMSGLGYGAYFVAKRYIAPLIKPPTPPQLEQDKASIDESFARAFELIEQVSKDTEAIKMSENERKERLDAALLDMETAIAELKQASRRRDDDTRRISDEVRNLQGAIPRAMKASDENTDLRMRELNTELRSLKTLLTNRMGSSSPSTANTSTSQQSPAISKPQFATSQAPSTNDATSSTPGDGLASTPAAGATSAATNPTERTNSLGRFGSKGGIPAWQLAAAKKNNEDKAAAAATAASGTAAEETNGA